MPLLSIVINLIPFKPKSTNNVNFLNNFLLVNKQRYIKTDFISNVGGGNLEKLR